MSRLDELRDAVVAAAETWRDASYADAITDDALCETVDAYRAELARMAARNGLADRIETDVPPGELPERDKAAWDCAWWLRYGGDDGVERASEYAAQAAEHERWQWLPDAVRSLMGE